MKLNVELEWSGNLFTMKEVTVDPVKFAGLVSQLVTVEFHEQDALPEADLLIVEDRQLVTRPHYRVS